MQVACLVSTEKGPIGPFQRCPVWMGVADAHEVVPYCRSLATPWPALGCSSMVQAKERALAALLVVLSCSRCSPRALRLWRRLRDDVLLVVRPSKSGRIFACVLRTVIGTIGVWMESPLLSGT